MKNFFWFFLFSFVWNVFFLFFLPSFFLPFFLEKFLFLRCYFKNRRDENKINTEIPLLIDHLKSYLKAGMQLSQAIHYTENKKKWCQPIRQALAEISSAYAQGVSFKEALDHILLSLSGSLTKRHLVFLFSSLRLGYVSGGNILVILEKVKEKTENSLYLEKKIRITTAQMRLQSLIIGLSPLFLSLVIWFVSPSYLTLFFRDALGIFLLFLMIFLNLTGFYFLHVMAKID